MSRKQIIFIALVLASVLIIDGAATAFFWSLMFAITWSLIVAWRWFKKLSQNRRNLDHKIETARKV